MHHTDVIEIQTCLTNDVWNCRNEWTDECCLLMDHKSHQTMSKYQFTGQTLLIMSDVMADSQKIQKTIWSFFTEQTFFAIYTWHFANISEQGLNQRSILVCLILNWTFLEIKHILKNEVIGMLSSFIVAHSFSIYSSTFHQQRAK